VTQVFIVNGNTSPWTVPTDWNNSIALADPSVATDTRNLISGWFFVESVPSTIVVGMKYNPRTKAFL
jgi:hypothetical protein